jgi:hypothetical protein
VHYHDAAANSFVARVQDKAQDMAVSYLVIIDVHFHVPLGTV